MKFKAALSEFQKILQKTLPVIPPKSTIPVLEHFHFSLKGNDLEIIATDQEITIQASIEVEGLEDGSVLVPARKISDLAKAMSPNQDVEFSIDPDNFDISFVVGKGNYSMKGLDPDNFLNIPELFDSKKPELSNEENEGTIIGGEDTAYFNKADMIKLANKTYFAVSVDEFRPAMTGVLFQLRGHFANAVATDSYRLVKVMVEQGKRPFPQALDIIIPSKTVEFLRKVDDDVILSTIENMNKITHVRFDIGKTVIITRIINEKFPPFETVIPNNNTLMLIADKKELLSSIKRVSLFSNQINKQIRLIANEHTLMFYAEDDETGNHGSDLINCDYSFNRLETAFNYKFLEEAINNVDEADTQDGLIELSFSEPNRPALIKPKSEKSELLMLLMPVRVS
jgi:DNA polymerase-3 subunit beta